MVMTMNNPSFVRSPDLAPERRGTDPFKETLESVLPVVRHFRAACLAFCLWAKEAARKAEEDNLRGERLAAYRARHRWKASDIRPLLSVGVSEVAQHRMARLKGKGRPVVKWHRPLEDLLRDKLTNWSLLFHRDVTPTERRRAFKVWPWWKHHVEALYRGELERARSNRTRGPHDQAERMVAEALRMSQGKIHAICGEIRAMRREDADSADFPPMLVSEFEKWMEHGDLPNRYRDAAPRQPDYTYHESLTKCR
jgi:hypothetical protein